MKKDFAQLVKELRIALRPQFRSIEQLKKDLSNFDEVIKQFDELESKRNKMLVEAGYNAAEFDALFSEYFMDFSSENPDEWIIKYDPNDAKIIHPDGGISRLSID